MIQGHLVVASLTKAVRAYLQLDPGLTLELAKKKVWQCEIVQEQQQLLGGAVTNRGETSAH